LQDIELRANSQRVSEQLYNLLATGEGGHREIDQDPEWYRWLLGIDHLSGQIRQRLLNDAVASGNADRVVAFCKGFQQEQGGAHAASVPSRRTRSEKPIYTRDQIRDLYAAHQKGAFIGRESEWARLEADIFAAQREGRVQGPPYLTK
jgi:hypothetical protein